MENYTKSAVHGAFIVLALSLVAAFLGYVARVLLARNLSIEEFGLFYAVFSFLTLIEVFKSFGFDKSLIKFIPEFIQKKQINFIKSSMLYVAAVQLITNLIIILFVYLFADYLAIHYFKSPQAGFVLKLMTIAFFLDSFVLTLKFTFQGFRKMSYFSSVDIVRMTLITAIILIGFKLNYGILSPVMAYAITPLILIFIFGILLVKKVFREFFTARFAFDKKLFKKMSHYSFYIILGSTGIITMGSLDTVMLTYFAGLTSVALYSVALPTTRVLSYFTQPVAEILFPMTSELWTAKKFSILKAGIEALYKYTFIVILPMALLLFSFADLIINVFFGERFLAAASAMRILSFGMVFVALSSVCGNFFAGIGKPQISTKMVWYGAVSNFAGNLILIPRFDIIGAAVATTLSFFIRMLTGLTRIRNFIDVNLPLKIWAKTLLAGLIFVLVITLLKKVIILNVWLETFIILGISGLAYVAMLFLFRILTINEIKDLYKRILK